MVLDQLQFLLGEERKLKEILSEKPDTKWATEELSKLQPKIKKLKAQEKD